MGVVADVRHSALEEASGAEMYLAMRQTTDYAAMQLVVRTALPPDSLAEEFEPLSGRLIRICPCGISKHFKNWSTKQFHRAALFSGS